MHAFLGGSETGKKSIRLGYPSISHSDGTSDSSCEEKLRTKNDREPNDLKQLSGLDSHAHIMIQQLRNRVSVIREVAQAMFLTLAEVLNSPEKRYHGEFRKLTEQWMSLEKAAHDTYQILVHKMRVLGRTHHEIPPELAEELMSLEESAHLILQEIHKIMQLEERAVEEFSRLDDEGIPLKKSAHKIFKTLVHLAMTHDPDKLDDSSGFTYDLETWGDIHERITLVKTDPEILNDEENLDEESIHMEISEQTIPLNDNDPDSKELLLEEGTYVGSSVLAHQIATLAEDDPKWLDDKEMSLEETIRVALQRLADKLAGRGREYRKLVDSMTALDKTDPESFLNTIGVIIALRLGIEFQKICMLEEKSSTVYSEEDEAFVLLEDLTCTVAHDEDGISRESQNFHVEKNYLLRKEKWKTPEKSFIAKDIYNLIKYQYGYNDSQIISLTEPTGIQLYPGYLVPFVGTQRSTTSIAMLTQSSPKEHPVDGVVQLKRNSHNSQCHTHTPDSVKQLVEGLLKVKYSAKTTLWEYDKQTFSAGNSLYNHFLTVLVEEPNDTRKSDEQTPSWPISTGLSSDNTAERDVKEFQPTENSNFYRGKELTHVMAAKVQNQVHHPVQAANNEGCSFSSQEDIPKKNEDIQVCTLHEIAAETTNSTLNEAAKQCEQQELSHPSYVAEYKASPSRTPSVVEVGMTKLTGQLCKEVSTNSTNYLSPVGRSPQTCKNVVQVPFHVLSVDETSTLSVIKTNPCLQSSVEKHSTSPLCPLSVELVADGSPNSLLVEGKASAACPLSSAGKQASSSPTPLAAAEKDSSVPCVLVQENRAVINNSLKELPASGQEAIGLACKLSVEKEVHDRVIPQPSVQRNEVDSSLSLSTVVSLSCEETACPHDLLSVKEEVSSRLPSPSADEQNASTH